MLNVHLPDGSTKQYDHWVTPRDVAGEIGPGLGRAALAAEIDGQIVGLDARLPAQGDVSLRLLTEKDPQALDVVRRSSVTSWHGR